MFGNPRGHLISTIRGGNNSIFSVLKVGFWLKGSYVRICGSSEIGPRMTVLTLRAKLKLYVGQFRPGGALSGTAEINVLKRLGVHVENIAPIWKQQVDMLGFCLWLAFWLGFIQKYSALLCRPKRCGSGGLETADASVRIAIRRRCLLASPAKHAGIHIDDLEYQEGTEKKNKRCFFRSHRAQPEREARWTAWTEAFTVGIVLARCKPRPRAHIYRPKLSFVYLWKTNLRKNKPPAVPSANLSSTQTPHLLWASLQLPNIFKNGSKTTSKRWRLVSAEK